MLLDKGDCSLQPRWGRVDAALGRVEPVVEVIFSMGGAGYLARIRLDLDAANTPVCYQFCKTCVILMMRVCGHGTCKFINSIMSGGGRDGEEGEKGREGCSDEKDR